MHAHLRSLFRQPADWLRRGQAAHADNSSIRRLCMEDIRKLFVIWVDGINEFYLAKKVTETHGIQHSYIVCVRKCWTVWCTA